MVLIECAPKVVDQLNMVANFAGGGRVFSFYAPFRCDYCDSEQRVLLEVSKDFEAIKAMKLADRPCPSCKESMYFDEDGSTFFSYVLGQGAFELDADVVAFLAAKLDYRVGTIEQKVRVDKIIEGRVTYLRLGGDLNNTFPREKLAEGLEGTVIVDVDERAARRAGGRRRMARLRAAGRRRSSSRCTSSACSRRSSRSCAARTISARRARSSTSRCRTRATRAARRARRRSTSPSITTCSSSRPRPSCAARRAKPRCSAWRPRRR